MSKKLYTPKKGDIFKFGSGLCAGTADVTDVKIDGMVEYVIRPRDNFIYSQYDDGKRERAVEQLQDVEWLPRKP